MNEHVHAPSVQFEVAAERFAEVGLLHVKLFRNPLCAADSVRFKERGGVLGRDADVCRFGGVDPQVSCNLNKAYANYPSKIGCLLSIFQRLSMWLL